MTNGYEHDGKRGRVSRTALVLGIVAGLAIGASGPYWGTATAQTPDACPAQILSTGTPNDDRFIDEAGKATTNSLLGGNDLAEMGDCNDTIYGGSGGDQLHGAYGNDNVYGETGDDRTSVCSPRGWCGKLYGGAGDDTVQGPAGRISWTIRRRDPTRTRWAAETRTTS